MKHREIRSFVLRHRQFTPAQQTFWDESIAKYGVAHTRDAHTVIDIGFGNGETVFELASAHPDWNVIGIEVYRPGILNLFKKLKEAPVANLRVIKEDATTILIQPEFQQIADGVACYFPDPWPKTRHHKRRLIQPAFIKIIEKALKPKGFIKIVTDWADYKDHILKAFEKCPEFKRTSNPLPTALNTRFRRRADSHGYEIHELVFEKQGY